MTQPDKLHLNEFHHPLWKHVHPLLKDMVQSFSNISYEADLLFARFNKSDNSSPTCEDSTFHPSKHALQLLVEIADSTRMLALRAKQVRMLYQSKDTSTAAEKR